MVHTQNFPLIFCLYAARHLSPDIFLFPIPSPPSFLSLRLKYVKTDAVESVKESSKFIEKKSHFSYFLITAVIMKCNIITLLFDICVLVCPRRVAIVLWKTVPTATLPMFIR